MCKMKNGNLLNSRAGVSEICIKQICVNQGAKSLQRSLAVGDFYGTGIEIWAGFGTVGITEKKIDLGRL